MTHQHSKGMNPRFPSRLKYPNFEKFRMPWFSFRNFFKLKVLIPIPLYFCKNDSQLVHFNFSTSCQFLIFLDVKSRTWLQFEQTYCNKDCPVMLTLFLCWMTLRKSFYPICQLSEINCSKSIYSICFCWNVLIDWRNNWNRRIL